MVIHKRKHKNKYLLNMEKRIKKEYAKGIFAPSKLKGRTIKAEDIKESEYEFYFQNGLDFIFEQKIEMKKETCTGCEDGCFECQVEKPKTKRK